MMLFSTLWMTREWGLRQEISEFQHPFLEQPAPWRILQIANLDEARKALSLEPKIIFELPLRVTEQGQLFLQFNGEFEDSIRQKKWPQQDYRGPKPYFYSFEQLQKVFPHILKVEDFLKEFPNVKIIFNIIDSAQNVHDQFMQMIQTQKLKNQFLVQSDTDVILKAIKEKEPLWVYGTSYPEINRFLSLESIRLEPAAQLRSDIYITPLTIQNRTVISQNILNELRRRKKKIIVGPVLSEAEYLKTIDLDVDGVIFYNLKDLQFALQNSK